MGRLLPDMGVTLSDIEETTVETPPVEAQPETPQAEAPDTGVDVDALRADLDKWRAMARKHEGEAKKLREQQMSDTEKAVADAEARGRAEARAEAAAKVAQARLEAALAGIIPTDQIADYVGDLNVANYLTEDGDVDADKVSAFRTRFEALKPATPTVPDLGQGNRGKSRPDQLSRDDLRAMSPDEIVEAKAAGRLNDVLGVPVSN